MAGDKHETGNGENLSRSISTPMLAIYGLGTVLGAGIYVVIGDIIGQAGALAPFAFLLAAGAAAFTALSYAELGARVPQSGGSAAFVAEGFGRDGLTWIAGWALIATGLVSAATITTGFVGYLGVFVEVSKWWAVPLLVGTLTFVAAVGVKQSAWFMGITTAAGVVGLLVVIFVAGGDLGAYPRAAEAALAQDGGWTAGVVAGSFLAFYAFIGFEDLVTLGEEAENAKRSLPIAIFFALIVALGFYVITAAVAVTTLDPQMLSRSSAPLVDVIEARGGSGPLLGILSLFIIVNGALAQIVMASRVVHDLGRRRGGAPEWLARLHQRTQTPLIATLIGGGIVTALALFFPTATLASATSFIILAVFFAANWALIQMKRQGHSVEDSVRTFPIVVPLCGLLSCAALLFGRVVLEGAP